MSDFKARLEAFKARALADLADRVERVERERERERRSLEAWLRSCPVADPPKQWAIPEPRPIAYTFVTDQGKSDS